MCGCELPSTHSILNVNKCAVVTYLTHTLSWTGYKCAVVTDLTHTLSWMLIIVCLWLTTHTLYSECLWMCGCNLPSTHSILNVFNCVVVTYLPHTLSWTGYKCVVVTDLTHTLSWTFMNVRLWHLTHTLSWTFMNVRLWLTIHTLYPVCSVYLLAQMPHLKQQNFSGCSSTIPSSNALPWHLSAQAPIRSTLCFDQLLRLQQRSSFEWRVALTSVCAGSHFEAPLALINFSGCSSVVY